MKQARAIRAKIVQHSEGLGVPNSDLVRKRAQELARIAGRQEANENDWRQAKRELHGGHSLHIDDGDDGTIGAATQGEIPGTLGHHVQNLPPEDAENLIEELVEEGMDEAVHEQMLEASRMNVEEEEE